MHSLPAYDTPSYRSAGVFFSGTGPVGPIDYPKAPATANVAREGDLCILVVETQEAGAVLSDAQGFVELANSPVVEVSGTAAQDTCLSIFVRYAPPDPASATGPTIADPGDHVIARMHCIRGPFRSSDPRGAIHASAVATSPTGTTNITLPGLTTTVDNCLIIHFATVPASPSNTLSTVTNASLDLGPTELLDVGVAVGVNTGTQGGAHYVVYGEKWTAGVVSGTTTTRSNNQATAMMTLAIKPPQFDSVAPTITPTPASASEVGAEDSAQIDFVDDYGDGIADIEVVVEHDDGTEDTIYRSATGFGPKYQGETNAISDIAKGKRIVFKRDGTGMPSAGATIYASATDKQGNRADVTISYTVTGYFVPSSPVIVAVTAEGGIAVDDPIELQGADADDDIVETTVTATYGADYVGGAVTETIYDADGFSAPWVDGSIADTEHPNGIAFSLERAGGLPSASVLIRMTMVDAGGRVTTEEFEYTTPFEPVPEDETGPTITLISPTSRQLGPETPIVVEVADETALSVAAVLARYRSGHMDPVHSGVIFGPAFQSSVAAREVLDGGRRHRFTILRDGGWHPRLGRPALEFIVRDARGNTATLVLP